jgi:hypothetical protein
MKETEEGRKLYYEGASNRNSEENKLLRTNYAYIMLWETTGETPVDPQIKKRK